MTINLQTEEGLVSIGTTDYPLVSCDMTAVLLAGETVSGCSTVLRSATTNLVVKLPDVSYLSGNVINQKIQGSLLTPGQTYRLIWIVTTNSGETLSAQTAIRVPY